MKTKLINYRTYNLDKSAKLDGEATKVIPIDRRSIFGNPFKITPTCTREDSIRKYKGRFDRLIYRDSHFEQAVKLLRGHTLGCWCTPLPCHGDVIIEYLEGLE